MKKKHRTVRKEPIDPERIRHVPPEGFSWVDRRFVREGFIDRLPPEASLLYLFLVAVSDAQGLSFYADPTISKKLGLDQEELTGARGRLVRAGLILYRYPLYQVLPLPPEQEMPSRPAFSSQARKERGGAPLSIGDILKSALAETTSLEGVDQNEVENKDMSERSNG